MSRSAAQSSSWTIWLLLAVLGVACAVFLTSRTKSEAQIAASQKQGANADPQPARQSDELAREPGQSRSALAGPDERVRALHLLITDEDANAIPEAVIFPTAANARQLSSDRAIAHSDAHGRAVLDIDAIRRMSPTGEFCTCAREYVPVTNAIPDDCSGETRIVLRKGLTQTVLCHDTAGVPLAQCRIFMSRLALPTSPDDGSGGTAYAVGAPRVAIYSALSDENGRCTIGGLEPGRHDIRVESQSYAVIDNQIGASCEVPGGPIEMTLGRIAACVVDVKGDDVLEYGFTYQGDYRLIGLMQDRIEAISKQLRRKYPSSLVAVAAQAGLSEPVPVQLRAYLRRRGFQKMDIPMMPVDKISPTQIDVSSIAEIKTDPVSIEVVDGAGHETQIPGFYVQVGGGMLNGLRVQVPQGDGVVIPPGTYSLESSEYFVRGHYAPYSITAPGRLRVVLNNVFRPCALVVRDQTGHACEQYALKLECSEGSLQAWVGRSDPPVYWLPIGQARISARALGCDECNVVVEVEDTGTAEPQQIELTLHIASDPESLPPLPR